ncbi:MAG TPA: superoxide dismutase family protein [Ignavibacteriaceae bacterium]|nr:superoxide dismutase family protein [Ignavibacteriaceae bacterium]
MFKLFFIPAVLFFILAGCQQKKEDMKQNHESMNMASTGISEASAELQPTKGNDVHGKVAFVKEENGIRVTADIEGLKPGKHGFHIHEVGDCSAPDGSSAGGHFNPDHKNHGAPMDSVRHVGDLGNLEADADGKAHIEWLDTLITLEGTNSIIGRSVIVHEKADDFKTQPTGNAGGRLACGIIEKKE